MSYSEDISGFKLFNPYSKNKNVYATYTETEEYPTGLKLWNVVNDNCPGNSSKFLVFSNCKDTQFTCNDGSCIPLIKKCDYVFDCEDNSDEFNCHFVKVEEGSYSKDISPTPADENRNQLEVGIDIMNFQVLKIDDVEENIHVEFDLIMQWIDARVTFTNLKPYQLTQLPTHEANKLWHPKLNFKESNTHLADDELEVLEAISETIHVDRSLIELKEQYLFFGHETILRSTKTFHEVLECQFELNRYPFDYQTCTLTLKLMNKLKKYVQLIPENKKIALTDEQMTVGEFFLGDFCVKQPRSSEVIIEFKVKRSFWKVISTTYIPTIALLIIVQLTFYFPLENIQIRATVVLSCFLILSTLLIGATSTTTSGLTYLQIWIIYAVVFTFIDICLQVSITHCKQMESKEEEIHKTSRVNDVCLRITIENPKAKSYAKQAQHLNYYCGKILSPMILGVFTFAYFSFALYQYYSF